MIGIFSTLARIVVCLMVATSAAKATETEPWPDLRKDLYGEAPIAEEDGTIALDAPVRAEDAALVPLTVTMPASIASSVKKVTLVVDFNPAPVAATFTFGPAAGNTERRLTTRLRIDRYTHVRAIMETEDGKLHMTTKFVKASGGCSAPAGKDAAEALAGLGRMQIKTAIGNAGTSGINEAQIMIKHPNYTGMQMDQITRDYTPARFVEKMEVKSGGELVFKMEGGISLSENPHFRFTYPQGANAPLDVTARDSVGTEFSGSSTQTSGS